MTKQFTYHMLDITIHPYDNKQYLLSARIKRKWVEVLTSEKTIYDLANREGRELATERNISIHYAQHIIGYARRTARNLLTNKYKSLYECNGPSKTDLSV